MLNYVYLHYWQQDADTLEPSQSGTTCDQVSKKLQKSAKSTSSNWLKNRKIKKKTLFLQNPENIKGVYKRYLLKQMEAIDTDIQYKKLKMRKLELEIQQLEKNASRTGIFKTMTWPFCFLTTFNFMFSPPTGSFKLNKKKRWLVCVC